MATGFIMVDSPNPTTPQGTLPRRGIYGALSGTCIVHTSEGNWAAGVNALTNLVRTRSDYGCYHRACDWADIAPYYPWEWETWQDSETNNWAVGIAAACSTGDWGNMPADVEEGFYRNMATMAADFVVYMRDNYGIDVPRRRLTGAEARARVPGFCAHGDSGISRTDPGAKFDWARFFRYIEDALNGTVPEQDTEDKMIVLAKTEGATEIWAGDGVVRRHIPNPQSLNDLIWLGNNGYLKVADGGKVATIKDLNAIGKDIAEIPVDTLNMPVPWYGYDGKVPASGRKDTTLKLQAGWHDSQVVGIQNDIKKVSVGSVALTDEDIAKIVTSLKDAIAPNLATELAKRLAE